MDQIQNYHLSMASNTDSLKLLEQSNESDISTKARNIASTLADANESSSLIDYELFTSSQDDIASSSCILAKCSDTETPNGSMTEPSSYEKFKASLNTDRKVATSTTAPYFMMQTVSSMNKSDDIPSTIVPPMTRGLKRKIADANTRTSKMCSDKIDIELPKCLNPYYLNQCNALVPFVAQNVTRISFNEYLKQHLNHNIETRFLTNNCRTIVPYVKPISLLEEILQQCSGNVDFETALMYEPSVNDDIAESDKITSQVIFQTTTLSWNDVDLNFADFENDESCDTYYTAYTDLYLTRDESGELTLTQSTLPENAENSKTFTRTVSEESMNNSVESRHAISEVVQPNIPEANCTTVLQYNRPISRWNQHQHEYLLKTTAPKAIIRPARTFWAQREFSMRPYHIQRKRQIIRHQRNKCYRFLPYNIVDRKWHKITLPTEHNVAIPSNISSFIQEQSKGMPTCANSWSFEPYQTKTCVRSSDLVEYLSFCRNLTWHSTACGSIDPAEQRGTKRSFESN